MKTILYNPIFINPQAYYVFPRLTRYLQPDNESTAEPANYELLFPSIMTLPLTDEDEVTEVVYPYPTYEGEELQKLLNSDKWTNKEKQL